MKFLIAILCLVSMTVFGAVPSYEKFRGAGGIVVTTNPPNGNVIIDGSGISSPTGGVSATTVTNIFNGLTLITTNVQCYVSAGVDSNNTVTATGFGLAAVNGLYRTNLLNGYTQGIYKIAVSTSYGNWVVSNATVEVYGKDIFGIGNLGDGAFWQDDFLGNPSPGLTTWGPITNCFTNIVGNSGATLGFPAVSTNLYLSASTGNDTNAVRGRIDRPWRTLSACLNATIPGDNLYVYPGDYPFSVQAQAVTNDIQIFGSGRGATRLGTDGGAEERLLMRSRSSLQNLTFYGAVWYGDGAPDSAGYTITNSSIINCDIYGSSDAVMASNFKSIRIENCLLVSSYDGIADWNNRPGSSNSVATLVNTRIVVTNGGFTTMHGISMGDSRIEMFGGSIDVVGGTVNNNAVFCAVDTYRTNKTGSALLSNVRIYCYSDTAGANNFVTNFNRLPIFLDNCTMEFVSPLLIAGSYTNQWSDRLVGIPNGAARTNRLVNLTTMTNALTRASSAGHEITVADSGYTASGTNLWILPQGGQTINGNTSTNITTDGGILTFVSDGANWRIKSAPNTAVGGAGEANTASSLGLGWPLPAGKSSVDLRFNSITHGSGLGSSSNANLITIFADWLQIASTTNVVGVSNYLVGVSNRLNTFTTALSNNVATASSNNVTVAPGSNITITTNGAGGVTTYTVNGAASGGNFSTNVTDGSATFFGTGVGAFRLYDNAQTEYSGMEAPFDVTSNNVTRAFSNSLAGVVVGQHIATGTNQAQRIQLAAGQYVTYNGTAYVASNLPSAGGGGGGTNYPPVIAIGTNVNVGVGVRQSVTVNTNASFKLVLTGTPLNGEHVKISVSNYSAVAIYMTNTFFDKTVASNVTVSAIPALSIKTFNLVNHTNIFTPGTRWELDGMVGKEMELAAAGGLVMHTNVPESIVTISNSVLANYATNADGTALFFSTNYSGMSNTLGLIISNSFTAPSNTVQEAGIGFDTSVFTTGGAAGTNWRPRGEFKFIPAISAAPAGGSWILQTRTNATGPAFTNMALTSLGNVTFPGGFLTLGPSGNNTVLGLDLTVANTLQLGLDASSPSAQLLKGPDASGANIAGVALTIGGGKPTGTGNPGRLLIGVGTNAPSGNSTVQGYGTPVGAGGTLKVSTATATNIGGGEDDLITYSVTNGQLSINGDFIEFVVWGTTAANANTKQLKVYFGATVLMDGGAVVLNGLSWKAHGRIVRTGAATQTATCELTVGGTLLSAVNGTISLTTAPAETLAAPITFKVTGTSAIAPADGDITQNGMTLKWYPGQ